MQLTTPMLDALCRKALRALDAQLPAVRDEYERLIRSGHIVVTDTPDGRVLLAVGGIPLCDATLAELARDAISIQ